MVSRSPLFYPLNRGMDADAGGAADLQTDVMRFMAILSLCLVPLATWFAGTVTSWLLASVGAAVCVFLPGLVLLKHEPKGVE